MIWWNVPSADSIDIASIRSFQPVTTRTRPGLALNSVMPSVKEMTWIVLASVASKMSRSVTSVPQVLPIICINSIGFFPTTMFDEGFKPRCALVVTEEPIPAFWFDHIIEYFGRDIQLPIEFLSNDLDQRFTYPLCAVRSIVIIGVIQNAAYLISSDFGAEAIHRNLNI